MSRDAFATTLAAILAAAFVAVWAYIAASTTSCALRHFLTAGLDELVPWHRLRFPRLPRRGRHAARWRDTTAEWLAKGRPATEEPSAAIVAVGVDLAEAGGDTLVAVDGKGLVHVFHGVAKVEPPTGTELLRERVEAWIAAMPPPLEVRVAEVLAYGEDEAHLVPARTDAGATADWSPVTEVAAMVLPPVVARTAPDAEEARILSEFAGLTERWVEVPEYLVEWGREVDAYLEAADLNSTPHRRWRQGVLDFPTSEMPRVLARH